MTYCKHFIAGIKQINFSPETASTLRVALIQSALLDLTTQQEVISKELALLPESIPENTNADKLLQEYKEKRAATVQGIAEQIEDIKTENPTLDWEQHIAISPDFIIQFAENFKNLPHLAETLSDAPPVIKQWQAQIFAHVLFGLNKTEQEEQLATLTSAQIKDMVEQAVQTYDTTEDSELRSQCQQLAELGVFAIMEREADKTSSVVDRRQGIINYGQFLRHLNEQLPETHQSGIFHSLANYHNSAGKTLLTLIENVADKLQVNTAKDWNDADTIQALKDFSTLCHTLRFGQEDRQEYISKRQDNIALDLFWGRNIRDIELFTKQGDLGNWVYRHIVERLAIAKYGAMYTVAPVETVGSGKKLNPVERKLEIALEVVKKMRVDPPPAADLLSPPKQRKPAAAHALASPSADDTPSSPRSISSSVSASIREKIFPLGDLKTSKQFTAKSTYRTNATDLIRTAIKNEFDKPIIETDPSGPISITFCSPSVDEETILDTILHSGGFNQSAYTIVLRLIHESPPPMKKVYTGRTLEEIARKIDFDGDTTCRQKFIEARKQILLDQVEDISQLGLTASDELILRKLLEINLVTPYIQPLSRELSFALELMDQGKFQEAVKVSGISEAIDATMARMTQVRLDDIPPDLRVIFNKALILQSSTQERQEKLALLHTIFESDQSDDKKIHALTTLFLEEYHAMLPTLGLSESDLPRIENDITEMARDFVTLSSRIHSGKPVLTDDEKNTYFKAISQVAQQLGTQDFSDFQFKITHSKKSPITVTCTHKDGREMQVMLDLGDKTLPYSLIKPKGNAEFIFSYGGSRGIVAPFAGLEEAYIGAGKEQKRFFTHNRLLGVGQYGSVKEVEALLSGLNQVIKKGYVPVADPTFQEKAREDLRTRPITARDDPLYRIESDIMQNLSAAQSASGKAQTTQYWITPGKEKPKGQLFTGTGPVHEYQILMDRAQGDTYADIANRQLVKFRKDSIAYHNPLQRPSANLETDLESRLRLAKAIVKETQRFAGLGFAHNDIKPENFLYNGSEVTFIDWATGGFQQKYTAPDAGEADVEKIFQQIFGKDLPAKKQGEEVTDAQGRFVKKVGVDIFYGINPHLQVLHGARNGTLAYIAPNLVLGTDRRNISLPPGMLGIDTILDNSDPRMDNWALTAMTFGICNRQAYFELVKGRAVNDYIVPDVLEVDQGVPQGLKIINAEKFNEFFACGRGDTIDVQEVVPPEVYSNPRAVMYIPSNQREGEPLHLYRHLVELQRKCSTNPVESDLKTQIQANIAKVLHGVHTAVATGEGLTKEELSANLDLAQKCIRDYQKLLDPDYLQSLKDTDLLTTVLEKHAHSEEVSLGSLLEKNGVLSELEIIATLPSTDAEKDKAEAILRKAVSPQKFVDKFIPGGPLYNLLKDMIAKGQNRLANVLLEQVQVENPHFVAQVAEQGLLHFALERGFTDTARGIVEALTKAGMKEEDIFALMMKEYGPRENQPHIKWATNAFHIAIRNNNSEQLDLILKYLPRSNVYDEQIAQAMHLSSIFGNEKLFSSMLSAYNAVHSKNPMTAHSIINMPFLPDDVTAYHNFLKDGKTNTAIAWKELEASPKDAHSFLLTAPKGTNAFPALITAAHSNYEGLDRLLRLAEATGFTSEQWSTLYKQTDEKGKNLCNYLLEQKQFGRLEKLLSAIRTQCGEEASEVLVDLFSNPHPVNPLANYLNAPGIFDEKIKVLRMTLDSISSDHTRATPTEQQARVIALLVNQRWLTEQAKEENNHAALRALLQNDAIALPYIQGMLVTLKDGIQEDNVAKQFFTRLLEEVTPKASRVEHAKVNLELVMPEILKQVAIQQHDFPALLKAFAKQSVGTLHERIVQLTEQVKSLELELGKVHPQLQTHQVEAERLRIAYKKAQAELEEANAQAKGAQDELARTRSDHAVKVSLLEGKIQQLTLLKDANAELERAKAALIKENEAHAAMIGRLQTKVSQGDEQNSQLLAQIAELRLNLASSEADAVKLRSQISGFQKQQTELLQRIEGLQGVEKEKEELAKRLQRQLEHTETAEHEAVKLASQYAASKQINEQLESRVAQLIQANSEMDSSLTLAKRQIELLQTQLDEATASIKIQTARTHSAEEALASTRDALTRAEQQNAALVTEAQRLTQTHKEELSHVRDTHTTLIEQLKAEHRNALEAEQSNLASSRGEISRLEQLLAEQKEQIKIQHARFDTVSHAAQSAQLKLSATESELTTARAKLEEQQSALETLQREQAKEVAKLKSEASQALESLRAEYEERIAPIEAELRTTKQQISELQSSLRSTSDELMAKEARIAELRAQLESAASLQASTQEELAAAQAETRAKQEELVRLETKRREDLASAQRAKEDEIASLNADHASRVEELAAQQATTETEKRRLQKALDALQVELRRSLDEAERNNTETIQRLETRHQETLTPLRAALDEKQEQVTSLQQRLDASIQGNTESLEQIEALRAQLESTASLQASTQEELAAAQAETRAKQEELVRLETKRREDLASAQRAKEDE
ncbi:hypothetical protein Lade_1762, partial [Legionella adelaidensis]